MPVKIITSIMASTKHSFIAQDDLSMSWPVKSLTYVFLSIVKQSREFTLCFSLLISLAAH